MRIVVTGATGNVGTSVVEALGRDAAVDEIVGIARRRPAWQPPKVRWVEADVATSDLVPHFAGADVVIHLAWLIQPTRRPDVLHAVNVTGSERVFRAVADARVPSLVHASSVGAYSPGPKDRPVDESWPTDGIPSLYYAVHKAAAERFLDRLEAERPELRVVRLRKALVFKREAASGIHRLFAGPLLPRRLLRKSAIPVVPRHPRLVFQAVHSHDAGDAYRLAALGDQRGAFNIAADPVLTPSTLAEVLDARTVPVPAPLLRAAADISWRLHLQPVPAGWLDLVLAVPVMDTTRARRELGWQPRVSAGDALLDLLGGFEDSAGMPTPRLSPETQAKASRRATTSSA